MNDSSLLIRLSGDVAVLIALALLTPVSANSKSARAAPVVIAGAEMHGMLYACDCAHEPGGGLAPRKHAIDQIRKERPVLLLDAGGFAAGGMYDTYTEGRERDSVRTLAAIAGMGMIGYDAVTLGDEELRYDMHGLAARANDAGLPLVSANVEYADGKSVAPAYRIIEKGGVRFGVTGVTTEEQMIAPARSVRVGDPFEAVAAIWDTLQERTDVQIILAHLGEKSAVTLAERFPAADIIVNGHRKNSAYPSFVNANTTVCQFGFQGKSLSMATVRPSNRGYKISHAEWLTIDKSVPADSATLAAVRAIDRDDSQRRSVLDLYIMAHCPYGLSAIREVLTVVEQFPAAELSIYFIGSVHENGRLKSLHGRQEIEEEKLWLAVHALYPEIWPDFLYLRAVDRLPVDSVVTLMDLDNAALEKWVQTNGRTALRGHYTRSSRLNVHASPTMFWNNQPVRDQVSGLRIADRLCQNLPLRPPVCDSLPACFDDVDCEKTGMIGVCAKEPRPHCVFKKAVAFDFVVILPDTVADYGHEATIQTTAELFPGAVMHIVLANSDTGKALIDATGASALPLYLFDSAAVEANNFDRIEPGLVPAGRWLTFKQGIMKKQYFLSRKEVTESVHLFVDPLFGDLKRVVNEALLFDDDLDRLHVLPAFKPADQENEIESGLKREEALRWLVLRTHYPEKFSVYLRIYATKPGSSYWMDALDSAGIHMKNFERQVKQSQRLLAEHETLLGELGISEPVAALFENRKLLPVTGARELRVLLESALRSEKQQAADVSQAP